MSINSGNVTQLPTAQVAALGDEYQSAASRWRQLLDAYPPKDGWAALVEGRPAPTPLYYADGSTAAPTIQFDATLRAPSGVVVANGSTLYIVEQSRDWECGETNARHRLLIALGFNPRKMDDDDRENIARAGLSAIPASTRESAPSQATGQAAGLALVSHTADPVENDPLAGVKLVDEESQGRQRKQRAPRPKPQSVSVPVTVVESSVVENDENPLGPSASPITTVIATQPATLAGAAQASEADAEADVGTCPSHLGPLGDAIKQRAEQRGIGVDWSAMSDEQSAVGWLLRHI